MKEESHVQLNKAGAERSSSCLAAQAKLAARLTTPQISRFLTLRPSQVPYQ